METPKHLLEKNDMGPSAWEPFTKGLPSLAVVIAMTVRFVLAELGKKILGAVASAIGPSKK